MMHDGWKHNIMYYTLEKDCRFATKKCKHFIIKKLLYISSMGTKMANNKAQKSI